ERPRLLDRRHLCRGRRERRAVRARLRARDGLPDGPGLPPDSVGRAPCPDRACLAGARGPLGGRSAATAPAQGTPGRHGRDAGVRRTRAGRRSRGGAAGARPGERGRQRALPLGARARAGGGPHALLRRRLPEGPRRAPAHPRTLAGWIARVDLVANLGLGLQTALTAANLLYCLLGVFLGTLIGVLPGLGPTATIAMLLPITFALPPVSALIMLAGIYYGSQYGGSTTSILVNLPGEAASV